MALTCLVAAVGVTACSADPEPVVVPSPKVLVVPSPSPEPSRKPVATRGPKERTATPHSQAPGSVRNIIASVFGKHAASAIRVAACESTLHPGARNGPHAGLFQINVHIHRARIRRLGFSTAQMFSAKPNVLVAFDLFREQGWRPWTCRWAA